MIREKINDLIAQSMKSKSIFKLKVLRLIKAEFQKYETSSREAILDDVSELKILKKLQKQWKEELEAFVEAGRDTFDLTVELKYLESFIPKEMSEEEQRNKAQDIINAYLIGLPIEERYSMKHLSPIIKIINKEYPEINGKLISNLFRITIGTK